MNPSASVQEIMQLFRQRGQEIYCEGINIVEHMLQCANLAAKETTDEEVIIAAFLHDIGHLLDTKQLEKFDGENHAFIGAKFVQSKGFSARIAVLIQNHVEAKRYLSLVDTSYYQGLSELSKQNLDHQGGRMTTAEAMAFEESPYYEWNVKMRKWFEAEKAAIHLEKDLEQYQNLMLHHLKLQMNTV
ncbi:MAG: HD domain-containing protein [Saprospiraceae bacterium]|nr:HD domain-containing protein [Saprospiraceae bacterium]